MIKKVFTVSGFDCAVCAGKAEAHILKKENVSSARMDFANNKLYITFKSSPWTATELAKVIKEVEEDDLFIEEYQSSSNVQYRVMNKKVVTTLIRIAVSIVLSLINIFILTSPDLVWVRFSLYCLATIEIGYDIFYRVIVHIKNRTSILDHYLLITIASIGALVLAVLEINDSHYIDISDDFRIVLDGAIEAAMVITLFQIGSIIENIATNKSKAAVMSAVQLRVDRASLVTDDGVVQVKPETLNIGDIVLVTTGEMIPTDGKVISGDGYLDTSSLTGEYIPVLIKSGSVINNGCILKSGSVKVEVTKEYKESTVSKIIELISSGGEEKSKADDFIAKFAKIYTPIVVLLSLLVFLVGLFASNFDVMPWIHTSLEILVIGCPCAIVISVPLAYFSAIGLASKKGIVVKGANYLDKLSELGILVTDKTGTLTHGSFSIQKVNPVNTDEDTLLSYLYIAECLSTHPIGRAICHGINTKQFASQVKDYNEIAGYGVSCIFKGKHLLAGGEKMMEKYNIDYTICVENGTPVYLAIDGKYMGNAVLSDEIKQDAQPMVDLLHHENVDIVLLTGDHEDNARQICTELGIDRWHSELLPEDKTKYLIEEMNNTSKAVAFIGDGINDAPSIIRSDIGIAMGGIGSDVAVTNADLVIMNDDPAKIYDAMHIAKIARRVSIFNIVFALLIKFVVFVLAIVLPEATWMMYVAILADTGLTVLLVLNSLTVLYRKASRPKLK